MTEPTHALAPANPCMSGHSNLACGCYVSRAEPRMSLGTERIPRCASCEGMVPGDDLYRTCDHCAATRDVADAELSFQTALARLVSDLATPDREIRDERIDAVVAGLVGLVTALIEAAR